MNFQKFILIFIVCASHALSGCATIINSGKQKIKIVTEPPGANIDIGEGLAKCTSPCNVELKVQPSLPIVASLDGYYNSEGEIKREYAISFWINAIFGFYGLIGMGIDYYNDRAWVWRNEQFSLVPVIAPPKEENPVSTPQEPQTDAEPVQTIPPPNQTPSIKSDLPMETKRPEAQDAPPHNLSVKYPKVDVARRIEWLFGAQSEQALNQHVKCVYEYLDSNINGVSPTLDQAIRATYGRKSDACFE